MNEVAKAIKNAMNRAGYTAAAENFLERARFYDQREMARLERFWLS